MTSIDKLREFANTLTPESDGAPDGPTDETERLYEIADEIEAEIDKMRRMLVVAHGVADSYGKVVSDYAKDLEDDLLSLGIEPTRRCW